jgi:hypothetical protein
VDYRVSKQRDKIVTLREFRKINRKKIIKNKMDKK